MYRVVIEEITVEKAAGEAAELVTVERYRQTVDVIDLPALIAAINRKPRKPRERKVKP